MASIDTAPPKAGGGGDPPTPDIPNISIEVEFSRPGILVLINDADWELEGEEAYELQSGDNILFVSTLHGG
ncbi:hypothetical protein F5X96DRAFT_19863 [Biscogniauxia mediterranea]|nr:hypothetical protein F5X96DRAFT_19863 [Biscogniauxia mediterranea]